MFTIAGGIILAVIILAHADAIAALVGAAILIVVGALLLLAAGPFFWFRAGPVLVFGAVGLDLGYWFVRGVRRLRRDARPRYPGDATLNAAQLCFGMLIAIVCLGAPAAALATTTYMAYLICLGV
jgi:hypothetical protein